jgi:HEAT repeat protein
MVIGYVSREAFVEGRPTRYWIGLLKSQDAGDRRQAALRLGERAHFDGRSAADTQVRAVVGALCEALADPDIQVRKSAATSLLSAKQFVNGVSGFPIDSLIRGLRDEDDTVRKVAVEFLADQGAISQSAVQALTVALKDKLAGVREGAARALGEIGAEARDATPALLVTLRDEDREVREQSAKSLGIVGPHANGALTKEIVTSLGRALKDEEGDVRMHAARSLGRMGNEAKAATAALNEALKDTDERVRKDASETLQKISAIR